MILTLKDSDECGQTEFFIDKDDQELYLNTDVGNQFSCVSYNKEQTENLILFLINNLEHLK